MGVKRLITFNIASTPPKARLTQHVVRRGLDGDSESKAVAMTIC
jgi:hypothetical protein